MDKGLKEGDEIEDVSPGLKGNYLRDTIGHGFNDLHSRT